VTTDDEATQARASYHLNRRGHSAPKVQACEDVSMFGDDVPEPEPTACKLVQVDGWPDNERR
jgi:hypothetical protein